MDLNKIVDTINVRVIAEDLLSVKDIQWQNLKIQGISTRMNVLRLLN